MSTFIHEAWVTEPADNTWSIPSGDDSQWKHTYCVVNHIEVALTKTSEMLIILDSLTEECSIPAVSRKFSGVERLSRRCWERFFRPVMASQSHAN